MELNNTGQLTLVNLTAAGNFPHIQTDCGTTPSMAPNGSLACLLLATATQDDYDVGTLVLSVTASAGHLGYASHALGGTKSYSSSISLNHSASMDVAVADDQTPVVAAGEGAPCPSAGSFVAGDRSCPCPQQDAVVTLFVCTRLPCRHDRDLQHHRQQHRRSASQELDRGPPTLGPPAQLHPQPAWDHPCVRVHGVLC